MISYEPIISLWNGQTNFSQRSLFGITRTRRTMLLNSELTHIFVCPFLKNMLHTFWCQPLNAFSVALYEQSTVEIKALCRMFCSYSTEDIKNLTIILTTFHQANVPMYFIPPRTPLLYEPCHEKAYFCTS